MPFRIFWNNKTIVHPGSYTSIDVSALKNVPISPVGVLCLLGTSPIGEPLVPLVFTNSYDIKQYFGEDSSFGKIADQIFKPSNDARIGQPNQVICIKVNNSTKAFKEDARFKYTSKSWGRFGRSKRVEWKIENANSPGLLTPGSSDLTLTLKTYDLTNADNNRSYILNETKVKITNNTNLITDPNSPFYGGTTFFVYKSGYYLYFAEDKNGVYPTGSNQYLQLDTSSIPNLKEAKKSLDTSNLGIDFQILTSESSISVNDLDDFGSWDYPLKISPGESVYIKSLFYDVTKINDPGIEFSVINKLLTFAGQGIPSPAESGSTFLDDAAGGLLHESLDAPGVESLYLSLKDLERAHAIANTIQSNVIVPLWDSTDLGAELRMGTYNPQTQTWSSSESDYNNWVSSFKTYIETRNGMFDSNEVFACLGVYKTDYQSLKDFITLQINSPYFIVTGEQCKISSDPTNWKSPYTLAAIAGSLICALPLGTSLTFKSLNILDVKFPFTYDLNKRSNREDLITMGHFTVWKNFKTGLYQIAKGNTAYTAEDNDGFTDIGLVNLGLYFQKDFNAAFTSFVGQDITNNVSSNRIYPLINVNSVKSLAISKFEQWKRAGYLTSYRDPDTGLMVPAYRELNVKIHNKQVEFSAVLTTVTGADWILSKLFITTPKG